MSVIRDPLHDVRRGTTFSTAHPAGCWVGYYSDRSGAVVFQTEVEALRHAVQHSAQVHFVEWGHDVFVEDEQ